MNTRDKSSFYFCSLKTARNSRLIGPGYFKKTIQSRIEYNNIKNVARSLKQGLKPHQPTNYHQHNLSYYPDSHIIVSWQCLQQPNHELYWLPKSLIVLVSTKNKKKKKKLEINSHEWKAEANASGNIAVSPGSPCRMGRGSCSRPIFAWIRWLRLLTATNATRPGKAREPEFLSTIWFWPFSSPASTAFHPFWHSSIPR